MPKVILKFLQKFIFEIPPSYLNRNFFDNIKKRKGKGSGKGSEPESDRPTRGEDQL